MLKRVWVGVLIIVVMALAVSTVHADIQEQAGSRGSIRGTVYEDKNADGKCADTGDPVLAGIPIKFVSGDGKTTVFLQSGANGTYGLVAAGLGTWSVSAEPPAGYVVTSKTPLQVFLGQAHEQRLVLGANFCVAKGTGTTTGGSTTGVVFLPTAGATVAPTLVWAAGIGTSLVLAGAWLEVRRRRALTKLRPKR